MFSQQNAPVILNKEEHLSLLVLPGSLTLPPDLEVLLYEEEVQLPKDDNDAAAADGSKKKVRPVRPTRQWALKAGDRKLVGNLDSTSLREGMKYEMFILRVEEQGRGEAGVNSSVKAMTFTPVPKSLALRDEHVQQDVQDPMIQRFMKSGKMKDVLVASWVAKYGRDVVDSFVDTDDDESENLALITDKRTLRRKRKARSERWKRERVACLENDDDEYAASSKWAPNDYRERYKFGDELEEGADIIKHTLDAVDTGNDELGDARDYDYEEALKQADGTRQALSDDDLYHSSHMMGDGELGDESGAEWNAEDDEEEDDEYAARVRRARLITKRGDDEESDADLDIKEEDSQRAGGSHEFQLADKGQKRQRELGVEEHKGSSTPQSKLDPGQEADVEGDGDYDEDDESSEDEERAPKYQKR